MARAVRRWRPEGKAPNVYTPEMLACVVRPNSGISTYANGMAARVESDRTWLRTNAWAAVEPVGARKPIIKVNTRPSILGTFVCRAAV